MGGDSNTSPTRDENPNPNPNLTLTGDSFRGVILLFSSPVGALTGGFFVLLLKFVTSLMPNLSAVDALV